MSFLEMFTRKRPVEDERVWELRKHANGMWYAVCPETGDFLQDGDGSCRFYPDRPTLETRMVLRGCTVKPV